MTAILCTALALAGATHDPACARGGHARAIPPRGGHAAIVLEPIGDVRAWTCIHNGTPVAGGSPGTDGQGEGPWNATGFYHGGLQMDRAFEEAYGADMLARYGDDAEAWTPRDQMVVAERGRIARGGYGPWPVTARRCGLLR